MGLKFRLVQKTAPPPWSEPSNLSIAVLEFDVRSVDARNSICVGQFMQCISKISSFNLFSRVASLVNPILLGAVPYYKNCTVLSIMYRYQLPKWGSTGSF